MGLMQLRKLKLVFESLLSLGVGMVMKRKVPTSSALSQMEYGTVYIQIDQTYIFTF